MGKREKNRKEKETGRYTERKLIEKVNSSFINNIMYILQYIQQVLIENLLMVLQIIQRYETLTLFSIIYLV